MKPLLLLLLSFIFLFVYITCPAQDNPFTSKKPEKQVVKKMRYPGFVQKFFRQISSIQHAFNKEITELARELKQGDSKMPFFIIIMMTFVYGMLHALGPGHGKTITFSYFLSQRSDIKKGILVGSIIGFFHALSAIIVVLVLYFIIKQSFLSASIEDLRRTIKLISYGIISIIGLFLLITSITDLRKKAVHSRSFITPKNKSIFTFALAIGLIPCTGGVIVMIFSISMGIISTGIIATLIMGLGMAITISLVGVSTIITRQGVLKIITKGEKGSVLFHHIFSITGSILILLLGVFLLTATL